jgi:hypothetical protein
VLQQLADIFVVVIDFPVFKFPQQDLLAVVGFAFYFFVQAALIRFFALVETTKSSQSIFGVGWQKYRLKSDPHFELFSGLRFARSLSLLRSGRLPASELRRQNRAKFSAGSRFSRLWV